MKLTPEQLAEIHEDAIQRYRFSPDTTLLLLDHIREQEAERARLIAVAEEARIECADWRRHYDGEADLRVNVEAERDDLQQQIADARKALIEARKKEIAEHTTILEIVKDLKAQRDSFFAVLDGAGYERLDDLKGRPVDSCRAVGERANATMLKIVAEHDDLKRKLDGLVGAVEKEVSYIDATSAYLHTALDAAQDTPTTRTDTEKEMGYCRFHNAHADLKDAYEHLEDDISLHEIQAQRKLIALCVRVADEYGHYLNANVT